MRFERGEKVDWSDDYKEEMINEYGKGPFAIFNYEEFPEEEDGHCQWISILKEVDGKKFVWQSFKKVWSEYKAPPPYMCVPPTFSNLHFKKVS